LWNLCGVQNRSHNSHCLKTLHAVIKLNHGNWLMTRSGGTTWGGQSLPVLWSQWQDKWGGHPGEISTIKITMRRLLLDRRVISPTDDISVSITFILIGSIFGSFMVLILLPLFFFSTRETRKRPVFYLSIASLILGIIEGFMLAHLYQKSKSAIARYYGHVSNIVKETKSIHIPLSRCRWQDWGTLGMIQRNYIEAGPGPEAGGRFHHSLSDTFHSDSPHRDF
jgi:hypothetical protein